MGPLIYPWPLDIVQPRYVVVRPLVDAMLTGRCARVPTHQPHRQCSNIRSALMMPVSLTKFFWTSPLHKISGATRRKIWWARIVDPRDNQLRRLAASYVAMTTPRRWRDVKILISVLELSEDAVWAAAATLSLTENYVSHVISTARTAILQGVSGLCVDLFWHFARDCFFSRSVASF